MKYTEEESKFVQERIDKDSFNVIALKLNDKFHEGEKVRSYDSVRTHYRNYLKSPKSKQRYFVRNTLQTQDFTRQDIPDEIQPVEDLLSERILKYKIKHDHKSIDPVNVKVNLDGVIGIAHFGDPHIDDDGTDIESLFEHAKIVNETDGLLAGNVGDNQNNWIGRLARLYGEQSTSAQESWQLTEHFVTSVPWLYMIGGNHDCWSGAGDPIEWMIGREVYTRHGSRIKLKFPNGREVLLNARHQWKGHSQWNSVHAISKAAQMGWDDDILVGGHPHVSGYQVIKDPKKGRISHCLQVASYKVHDAYAERLGLNDKSIFNCPVTVIDPDATDPVNLVRVCFTPEEGADYVKWKRSKK